MQGVLKRLNCLIPFHLSILPTEVVRSLIPRHYLSWTHESRDDLLENKSFLYEIFVFRTCCCLETARTYLSFHGTLSFRSLYRPLH